MKSLRASFNTYKSYIFLGLIIVLALAVFVPEIDNLKESFAALKDADMAWVLFGLVIFFCGLPIVAWQFVVIALKSLTYFLTLRVQMAGLFVSKLLPSSLGTFSLNFYYLTKKQHTATQAASVMAVNAITSGLAYVFIIGFAILFDSSDIVDSSSSPAVPWDTVLKLVFVLIAACVGLLLMRNIRTKLRGMARDFAKNLADYRDKKGVVVSAIFLNFAGSLTSLLALWASAHALGVQITIIQALVAYVFGNVAAGLVPTPGGLGAAEAGIYAGLVVVGVPSTDALTITLVYRVISYWIPTIPGYYYFWSLRKDVLSDFRVGRKKA